MLSLITKEGKKIKINGCLNIRTFHPGEIISITQQESVILKTSRVGKHHGEIIILAVREGIQHEIIVEKFPKGETLYKIKSFTPTPIL